MAIKLKSLAVPGNVINLRLTATILFFIGAGVSLATYNSGQPFQQDGATVAPGESTGVPITQTAVRNKLNSLRSGAGFVSIRTDNILDTVAKNHNLDMYGNTFVGLASSTGQSPQAQVDALTTPGFFSNVNMLVFVGTSGKKTTTFDDVLNAWLSNPTTSATLFDPNYNRMGFNQVDANGTTFWTLVLAMQSPVTFLADTTNGSPVLTNVSSMTGIALGRDILGPGIPPPPGVSRPTIIGFSGNTIIMSRDATADQVQAQLVAD